VDTRWNAALRGEPYDVEHRILADGRVKWVREKAYLEFDGAGGLLGGFGITQDITTRKQIEEELRRSLREIGDLRTAMDEHSIVAITDPQGRITFVNDKFCAISKYTREELIGQDHRIINSGHHSKEFIRNLWTTITQGRIWHGEIKNRAKDGSHYWVATTIVPFLDESGNPRQFVAIRTDITERRLAEESLRANNDELTRFNRVAVDRELRMIELKKEINALCAQTGQAPRHRVEFSEITGHHTSPQ
jgi:PAS domain S-box-containing protein